jgi:hypothetical protein
MRGGEGCIPHMLSACIFCVCSRPNPLIGTLVGDTEVTLEALNRTRFRLPLRVFFLALCVFYLLVPPHDNPGVVFVHSPSACFLFFPPHGNPGLVFIHSPTVGSCW